MSQIIYNSGFMDNTMHGGGHRWAQLEELIEGSGLSAQPFRLPDSFSLSDKVSGFRWLFTHGFFHGRPRRSWLYMAGLFGSLCQRYRHAKPHLILTETLDIHGCILAALAHRLRIPLIICPPNLDSLLHPYRLHDTFHPRAARHFSPEFAWLSLADTLFTISSEESFVLNNAGLPAHFLPFFPTTQKTAQLTALRTQRSPKNFYLVLGSAINPPTRDGISRQLDFLGDALSDDESVIIVGRGTQTLQATHPSITIEGEVSDERLGELLCSCKAAWLHQTQGVGALTRISELLLSGVPIVASAHAVRSASYADLYVYEDFDQALELLRGSLPSMAALPSAPSTEFFHKTLHYLCR